jgi:6-pyruvoyltetrahydropterin/6-carboxytetrahydropterin synthase
VEGHIHVYSYLSHFGRGHGRRKWDDEASSHDEGEQALIISWGDKAQDAVHLSSTSMRARLTKDFTFEAAQTLPNAPEGHKCRSVHGHSFKVEVSVEGDVDPKVGWIYDHANISNAMKPLLKVLDHAYLNDIGGLENPTIEIMAEWFWKKLEDQCPGLCEIIVHETATARCAYRGN